MLSNPHVELLDRPKLANLRGHRVAGGNVLFIRKCPAHDTPTYFDKELTMKNLKTTTAVLKNQLAEHGITMNYYFDRLHIYFDADTRKENIELLLKENSNNKFMWQPLPHNEHLDRKLELFQPGPLCMAQLIDPDIVAGDCAINYVEFAVDFITGNKKSLEKLVRFFNRHLVHIPSQRGSLAFNHYLNIKDETVYFTAKGDKKCLLFYNDKPARNTQHPFCLHIEYRLAGLKQVKDQNVITIKDLIDFDHEQLWNTLLDLRKPNLTDLGVACRNGATSRQADHKRGAKVWSAIESLQQYLSLHSAHESAFLKMTPANLERCLVDFMNDPY
jgi:hypothetical protein